MQKPKISIVTICYNAEKYIVETLESVLSQSYPNIECIIVDGKSTDKTLELIAPYKSKIDCLVSEKDKGIYDAMNKGLHLATGQYILFMNTGDIFYNASVVEKVFNQKPADIYFGETLFINDVGNPLGLMSEVRNRALPENMHWKKLRYGMVFSHQSVFVNKEIAPDYNLSHPYSADVDWIINALKQAKSCIRCSFILSKCRMGGYTQIHQKASLKDRYKVLQKHFGIANNLLNHCVIFFRTFGKKRIDWKQNIQ